MSKAKRKNDEEYGNVYEEYSANAELSTREKKANPNLNNKKLIMKKWCMLFVVLSFSIGALVGSLSMYFMLQKDATTPITTTTSTAIIITTASTTTTASKTSTTSATTTASITTPGSRLFIYSKEVIYSLKFNNDLYGRPNGGVERIIEFEPNEVVEEFQYHKTAWWWPGTLCSFAITTNVITYHQVDGNITTEILRRKTYNVEGFEEWKAENPSGRYGYCGKQLFSVKVSSNEDLNSFFNSELVIGVSKDESVNRGPDWILGFKNETVVETN